MNIVDWRAIITKAECLILKVFLLYVILSGLSLNVRGFYSTMYKEVLPKLMCTV